MDVKFREIDRARLEPDVYAGPNFNEHRKRWIVSAPKEGDCSIGDTLTLNVEHFPAGTHVVILVPECPQCHDYTAEDARDDKCLCGFDWKAWALDQYA